MVKTTNADGRSEPRSAVVEAWHRTVESRDRLVERMGGQLQVIR